MLALVETIEPIGPRRCVPHGPSTTIRRGGSARASTLRIASTSVAKLASLEDGQGLNLARVVISPLYVRRVVPGLFLSKPRAGCFRERGSRVLDICCIVAQPALAGVFRRERAAARIDDPDAMPQ